MEKFDGRYQISDIGINCIKNVIMKILTSEKISHQWILTMWLNS